MPGLDLRRHLIASASVVALLIGSAEVRAQTAPTLPAPPAIVAPRDSWTLSAAGGLFWQADGGHDFGPPLGALKPLRGLNAKLGLVYQPALSPWSFGLSGHYGKTRTKQKAVQSQQTSTHDTNFIVTSTTYSGAVFTTLVSAAVVRHSRNTTAAARASSHLVLDFTIGRDIGLGGVPLPGAKFTLEGGLRFARLSDRGTLTSTSAATTTIIPTASIVTSFQTAVNRRRFTGNRRFVGAGPRFGASFATPLAAGFGLEGGGGVSLLYGQVKDQRTFDVNGVATTTETKANRFVPGLDASLALSYALTPNATLALGYQVEAYFGAFPGAAFAGNPSFSQDKNYLTHGPFLRASVTY
ncbi:MAG: Lpg1974 family pore-forming outer membrane protein [Bauldia sp.]